MNHWDSIRLKARRMRRVVLAETDGDASAKAMLLAVTKLTGIGSQGLPAKDPLLYKAVAVLHSGMVWFNQELAEWEQIFNQIHEYAHHWQHKENFICYRPDIDAEASEDTIAVGSQKVDGYGPHERRELEANVFAREFLLPGDELRKRFLAGENAAQIAETTEMPVGIVIHCLMRGVLGTELQEIAENKGKNNQIPEREDKKQVEAARAGEKEFEKNAREKVVLVDAGPGTGKTRTLIKRIIHLTEDRKIPSPHILALTFSNKAAEEIYVRVRAETNQDMSNAWMGTFHKFGLDLIRRYHQKLGVSPNPKVIDALDARLLLEQNLGLLKLKHYRSLRNPTVNLRSILSAISGAKDELLSPPQFEERIEHEYRSALTKAETGKIEKALEAAHAKALETAYAYGIYRQLLEEKNWLDYGDLLFRAVRLLSENDDVRQQLRDQYKHILVDEYQDVNVASRILLKLLAGDGSGLWVVGDARQAIYRFIGASPTNILLLTTEDFPDAQTIKLDTNYRSQRPVVKVFAACSKGMNVNETEQNWNVSRKDEESADVRFFVSSDEKTEAADLAEEIKRLAEAEVEYRKQAVLCRYHEDLASLSVTLEDAGIPVLYLGNFFERPEIRDLLQIIAMATEPDGRSLYRLANFKEYGFEREDIRLLTDYVLENQFRFPGGLKRIAEVEGLSSGGRNKLELLGKHFKGFHPKSSAWNVLSQYLFVKSNYLRHLAGDNSVRGKQKRLAIYQLLLLAHQLREELAQQEGDTKRNFLNYIRHLRIVGEDKQLRQTPVWADDINAVRLLTIHAAKGLEWNAVHLPTLSDGKFPKGKAPEKLLLSKSKSSEENVDWQAEEENCLFFVALSRARDYLRLYRARQYEFRQKQASRLLNLIQEELPSAICKPLERIPPPTRNVTEKRIVKIKREYAERQLRVYHQCPLEYEYRYILGISSPRSETPIGKTHLCVYRVGDAIKKEQKAGREISWDFAEQKLTEIWAESGPLTHPYEAEYRTEAKQMIRRIVGRDPLNEVRIIQPDWRIELENGIVIVRPDFVDLIDDGSGKMKVVVEMLNFGSSPEKAPQDDVYALLDIAAEQTYPEFNRQIRATYMTDNQTIPIKFNNNWRKIAIRNYEKAINGVLNEVFNAKVDKNHCPFCSYYMMCSSNDGNEGL